MGYYTRFRIMYSHREKEIRELIKKLLESDDGTFFWAENEEVKWYDYEENVLKVSNHFPDVLITVYGAGEESNLLENDADVWVQYFQGGKKTKVHPAKVQITYSPFNARELLD